MIMRFTVSYIGWDRFLWDRSLFMPGKASMRHLLMRWDYFYVTSFLSLSPKSFGHYQFPQMGIFVWFLILLLLSTSRIFEFGIRKRFVSKISSSCFPILWSCSMGPLGTSIGSWLLFHLDSLMLALVSFGPQGFELFQQIWLYISNCLDSRSGSRYHLYLYSRVSKGFNIISYACTRPPND